MYKLLLITCVLFAGSALAEQVKISKCPEQSLRECTVSNVHINPCPEADEGLPCRVKKGRSVSISFDMTPKFRIETLHSQAYWPNGRVDLPLIGMETDGCKSTTCPIEENTTQSYQWQLDVDKKFPSRQYTVKMMMKNQEDNFCCFLFNIKLTK